MENETPASFEAGVILLVEGVEKLFQRGAVIFTEPGQRADGDIRLADFDFADVEIRVDIDDSLG